MSSLTVQSFEELFGCGTAMPIPRRTHRPNENPWPLLIALAMVLVCYFVNVQAQGH